MAIILGSCGCGCGSTCEKVTTNCNFVLRKYDDNTRPSVSWTSEATDEEKICFDDSPSGCQGISFEVFFSACTGEGEVYRSGVEQTLLGIFTSPYEDESIDFDNIGEVELTDGEKNQPLPPCKFSYNFSFIPEDGVYYYVMALPCSNSSGSFINVNLSQDGRAYFLSSYNETTKLCFITQTSIVVPDTNAPESQ